MDFFKQIESLYKDKNYIIWADCGKHFRNKDICGYLFKELREENIHGL